MPLLGCALMALCRVWKGEGDDDDDDDDDASLAANEEEDGSNIF